MPNSQPDSYYRDFSLRAIEKSLADSKARGLSPEETRQNLRGAFPFAKLRSGRPYKIWQRQILEKEAALGYPPKKHKSNNQEADHMGSTMVANCPVGNVTERAISTPEILTVPMPLKAHAEAKISPLWAQFLKDHPKPIDKEKASDFLRNHCVAHITMHRDHDKFRVVLKTTDGGERKIKFIAYRQFSGKSGRIGRTSRGAYS